MNARISELCFLSAGELARRIKARDVSALEVMQAHLAQIERVNPQVNAIVTLDAEGALARARDADERAARGDDLGPLHGLPVAHKDLVCTRGMRTTFGSPIYKNFVPAVDAIIVERQREAGAITVGKTNTPEFGAGSQTFNTVFGATHNPYDPSKTCGGSSGGAAVALACGMVPLADGSDFGGSLRNPANFCNVVGLRPSIGTVPRWPGLDLWNTLSVEGPMARTVADVALYLSVLAGHDSRDPISQGRFGAPFRRPLERDFTGLRIAWSRDLGGLPVDPVVTAALESQRKAFEQLGCIVEEASPDLSGANAVFQTLRGLSFVNSFGDLMDKHPGQFKEAIVWNVKVGRSLTGSQIAEAVGLRTKLFERMREFMEQYEFLLAPVSQVPPFPIDQQYPTSINGVTMQNYLDWMRSCSEITVTGHPAISVPCAFVPGGLPVGIQIVGRYREDFAVLQLAHAFEQITKVGDARPDLAR